MIETIEPVEEVPSILKKRTRKSVIKPSVEVVSIEEKVVKVEKPKVVKEKVVKKKVIKEKVVKPERTPEQIQMAKDKMALVRAMKKPKDLKK